MLLKAENLQRTGAFKIRGAYNTVAQLSEEERGGVVTASAGNHGQAVAWAAREAGIPATIFVPEAAPMAKVEAARGYGAQVELAGEGFDETLDGRAARERTRRARPSCTRSKTPGDRGTGDARARARRSSCPRAR